MSLSIASTPPEEPRNERMTMLTQGQTKPPQRILVVDDDPSVRQLVCLVLLRVGYQVDSAEDGEIGLEMLQAMRHTPNPYVLLITDNNMPKMSGVDLIQKARSEGLALPIILATGTPPMNMESLQLAAILLKPFTVDHLVRMVENILPPATVTINPNAVPGTSPGSPTSRE